MCFAGAGRIVEQGDGHFPARRVEPLRPVRGLGAVAFFSSVDLSFQRAVEPFEEIAVRTLLLSKMDKSWPVMRLLSLAATA
jgi:hypothetical protein